MSRERVYCNDHERSWRWRRADSPQRRGGAETRRRELATDGARIHTDGEKVRTCGRVSCSPLSAAAVMVMIALFGS
jgi:hypothetical protein